MMLEVKVFLDEGDTTGSGSTYEHLLRTLLREGIAGGSLYRALMGFGNKRHLHQPGRFGTSDEAPLMLMFIDEEAKVREVLPMVREVIGRGLITVTRVEAF